MKNLNRKLSVIALSGMAVFGGVAASGIQAFAASDVSVFEQEVQDKDIAELNELILKADFSYKALSKHGSKKEAREAMRNQYGKAKKLNNASPSVNKKNIKKVLGIFAQNGDRVFVLKHKSNYYVVGLPDLLK